MNSLSKRLVIAGSVIATIAIAFFILIGVLDSRHIRLNVPQIEYVTCADMMPILVIMTPRGPLPLKSIPGCFCLIKIDNEPFMTMQTQDPVLCTEEKEDKNGKFTFEIPKGFRPEFRDQPSIVLPGATTRSL